MTSANSVNPAVLTPLVTVVVPCFNAAAHVREAIDSALAQSYPNTEVVAVDDGSTDDTLEVLRSYGDRIRMLTGPNAGGAAARNKGLDAAHGELIQFLDADDLIRPDKLEIQVPALLNSAADVVYCDMNVVDLETGDHQATWQPRSRDHFRRVCFDIIQTSAPLHRREDLMRVGGFTEGLPCSQEKDLHVRLACSGQRFEHLPGALVTYRQRSDSVSANYQQVMEQYAGIVERGVATLEKFGQKTDDRLRLLAELLMWSGRQLWRVGARESAMRHLDSARELHPSRGLGNCSLPMRVLHRMLGSRNALRFRSAILAR